MFRKICDGDEGQDGGFNKYVGDSKICQNYFPATAENQPSLLGARVTIWQKWNVFY